MLVCLSSFKGLGLFSPQSGQRALGMWFGKGGTLERPDLVIILVTSLLPWKLGLEQERSDDQSQDEANWETLEGSVTLPASVLSVPGSSPKLPAA